MIGNLLKKQISVFINITFIFVKNVVRLKRLMFKLKKILVMTKKEKNEIIKALENEIKNQMPVVLDGIKCDTMSDEQLHYFVSGVEKGMKLCVDILKEERV